MRTLMLLRHAKAVRPDRTMRDQDRPLAPRGHKDAPEVGAYMGKHELVPDRVLVSPSKRTRETWALLSPALGKRTRATFEDRIYEASPQAIFNLIQETGAASPALLIVGHNPSLNHVAVNLIASGDLGAREKLLENLPTSGLVVIEFPFDDWGKLHAEAGRLTHFVTPKSIKASAD
jgi:phosphohistidine phosphatase